MNNKAFVILLGAALGAAIPSAAQSEGARTAEPPVSAARVARASISDTEAAAVVAFWRDAGPQLWFAKDAEFDRRFRERFLPAYEAAAEGELMHWRANAEGALALTILLDQFPRNAFRDTPRMFATDALARETANVAIGAGHDRLIEVEMRLFLYIPFGHSEDLADQERSVALNRSLGQYHLLHAERHREIIRRFGRFPHRNPILGRTMTEDEQRYLDDGGYAG